MMFVRDLNLLYLIGGLAREMRKMKPFKEAK